MTDARHLRGSFWLAAEPENRVAGILTFADGQPSLEVFGGLTNDVGPHAIYGHCEQKVVTLLGWHVSSAQGGLEGIHLQGFLGGSVLLGSHLESAETRFTSCTMRTTHLDAWVAADGFETGFEDGGVTVVRHTPRPAQSCALADGGEILLRQTSGWRSPNVAGASLTASIWLDIRFGQPLTLDEVWDSYLVPIEDLLSVCTGVRNHVTALGVSELDLTAETGAGFYEVLEVHEARVRTGDAQELPWFRQWLPFTVLGLEKTAVWIDGSAQVRGMARLGLAARESDGFAESDFFLAASAAEGLHRRLFPDATRLSAVHAEVARNAAKAAVGPDVREMVEVALMHLADLTYRQRLRALIELSEGACVDLLGAKPPQWINRVVEARNRYAHWLEDGDTSEGDTPYLELYYLTGSVVTLVFACLLVRAGMSGTVLGEQLQRTTEYKSLVQLRDQLGWQPS